MVTASECAGRNVSVDCYFYYLCPRIMKFYPGIFFLLTFCLVALPTGAARACSDTRVSQETISVRTDQGCCETDGENCVENFACEDCPPDSDGCGHCHCPDCVTTACSQAGFFKNTVVELLASNWLLTERTAHFCYSAPCTSAHLAALFQPPRA